MHDTLASTLTGGMTEGVTEQSLAKHKIRLVHKDSIKHYKHFPNSFCLVKLNACTCRSVSVNRTVLSGLVRL